MLEEILYERLSTLTASSLDARLKCRRAAGTVQRFTRKEKKRYLAVLQDFHCELDSASVQPVMFLTPGNACDCQELQVIVADWPAGIRSHVAVAHLQPLAASFPVFYSR